MEEVQTAGRFVCMHKSTQNTCACTVIAAHWSAVRKHACVDRVTPILATRRGQRKSTSRPRETPAGRLAVTAPQRRRSQCPTTCLTHQLPCVLPSIARAHSRMRRSRRFTKLRRTREPARGRHSGVQPKEVASTHRPGCKPLAWRSFSLLHFTPAFAS